MSRLVLLDAEPLGLVTNPRPTAPVLACRQWLRQLMSSGVLVRGPEIADYEVRRELLRANRTRGLRELDRLTAWLGCVPLTTLMMRQAAGFWAQLRQQGQPTAPDLALDSDVILAAQAAILQATGDDVIIATTNAFHLARLVPADHWSNITG